MWIWPGELDLVTLITIGTQRWISFWGVHITQKGYGYECVDMWRATLCDAIAQTLGLGTDLVLRGTVDQLWWTTWKRVWCNLLWGYN